MANIIFFLGQTGSVYPGLLFLLFFFGLHHNILESPHSHRSPRTLPVACGAGFTLADDLNDPSFPPVVHSPPCRPNTASPGR